MRRSGRRSVADALPSLLRSVSLNQTFSRSEGIHLYWGVFPAKRQLRPRITSFCMFVPFAWFSCSSVSFFLSFRTFQGKETVFGRQTPVLCVWRVRKSPSQTELCAVYKAAENHVVVTAMVGPEPGASTSLIKRRNRARTRLWR